MLHVNCCQQKEMHNRSSSYWRMKKMWLMWTFSQVSLLRDIDSTTTMHWIQNIMLCHTCSELKFFKVPSMFKMYSIPPDAHLGEYWSSILGLEAACCHSWTVQYHGYCSCWVVEREVNKLGWAIWAKLIKNDHLCPHFIHMTNIKWCIFSFTRTTLQ